MYLGIKKVSRVMEDPFDIHKWRRQENGGAKELGKEL